MKDSIIVAFDSFKGSLTALEAGKAAVRAIRAETPHLRADLIPLADGGEGTVSALVTAMGGEYITATVIGPLGDCVSARYGVCADTAVIEIAEASGLTLIPPGARNPWFTTTYGVGQLILDAIGRGCRKFIIGLGGSATCDGGVGMLRALGYRFLDSSGQEVWRGGGAVGRIAAIDTSGAHPKLGECSFSVACDVTNPLTGPEGASYVFGPQKGADPPMVKQLDAHLASFASLTERYLGRDCSQAPGAGAAGGLGFAFMAYLGAELQSGIDLVLDTLHFDSHLQRALLIFTGEGRVDKQTLMGKAPSGVLARARARGVPVILLGGTIDPRAVSALEEAGFAAIIPIVSGTCDLAQAMQPHTAAANLTRTIRQLLRTLPLPPA